MEIQMIDDELKMLTFCIKNKKKLDHFFIFICWKQHLYVKLHFLLDDFTVIESQEIFLQKKFKSILLNHYTTNKCTLETTHDFWQNILISFFHFTIFNHLMIVCNTLYILLSMCTSVIFLAFTTYVKKWMHHIQDVRYENVRERS